MTVPNKAGSQEICPSLWDGGVAQELDPSVCKTCWQDAGSETDPVGIKSPFGCGMPTSKEMV